MTGACHVNTMFHRTLSDILVFSVECPAVSGSSLLTSDANFEASGPGREGLCRCSPCPPCFCKIMPSSFFGSVLWDALQTDLNKKASDDDSSTEKRDKTRLEYQHPGPSQNSVLGFGQEKQPITAAARSVPAAATNLNSSNLRYFHCSRRSNIHS